MNLGDLHQVWEIKECSDQLGIWTMPVYVELHTIALALCLPFAVFIEACASMLFGFLPAVFYVFTAKILGASLSFWISRPYVMDLRSTNKTFINDDPIEPQRYFELLEKDTIKFGNSSREYVLLHEGSSTS